MVVSVWPCDVTNLMCRLTGNCLPDSSVIRLLVDCEGHGGHRVSRGAHLSLDVWTVPIVTEQRSFSCCLPKGITAHTFTSASIFFMTSDLQKAILSSLFFILDFFGAPVQAQKRPEKDKNKRPISISKTVPRSPGNTIFSPLCLLPARSSA